MSTRKPERRKRIRRNDPLRRGRRADPRTDIVLPASIDAISGRRRINLLDISSLGACLEGHDLPTLGREVILKCGSIDTFGSVAWSMGERCGVRFDRPISAAILIALRDVASAAREQHQTPEELHAMADWLNGLAR